MNLDVDLDLDWIDVDAPPLPFEEVWLPQRPLAARKKDGGYYRTSRARALTMPYIEANPTAMTSLIITDHDGGRADEIAAFCGLPVPSYIAMNSYTRDGHIVYALARPVCTTDAARRGPVNLLARIEAGINDVLAGDVAYGARTTKNPTHVQHQTLWGPISAIYTLADLAGPLEQLGALPRWAGIRERREKLATSATGRNVDLFDTTRKWSYRRRGDYTELRVWEQVVADYAWDRNVDTIAHAFTRGPMEAGEVTQIARSISRWTWRHIVRTFSEEQARRGRLGGLKTSPEELSRRGKLGAATGASKGGQVVSDAKREANRKRATKVDSAALLAAALAD